MLDFGLGSLQALTLKDLVHLLVMMAACIAAVALIGFDGIVVAIGVRYAIPILAELGRRAWCRIKSRLCAPG
jgi:hypothetical protein